MRQRDPALNAERRKVILKAASACFVKSGFHSTSMKDVCAAAGMSPGTLYHYFASKTEIIAGIIADEAEMTRALLALLKNPPLLLNALFEVLDIIATEVTAEELVLHTEIAAEIQRVPHLQATQQKLDEDTQALIAASLASAQQRGEVDRSLEPAHTARLILAMIDGLLWRATLEGPDSVITMIPAAKQALARMLLAPENVLS